MSEGLTKTAQHSRMRSTKQVNNKLEKSANNIQFDWVKFMSKEYFGVVEAVNECYKKKKVEIGKCKEVFQHVNGNWCELLTAKSKKEFFNAKKTYCCVTVAT